MFKTVILRRAIFRDKIRDTLNQIKIKLFTVRKSESATINI